MLKYKIQISNKEIILLLALFVVCLFLTFQKHSKTGYFNYHSEIWGDKSGYYVYLPALFIYQFNSSELPENIVERTGYGFTIDTIQNKIKTKYTCGIAILQSPFYLVNHIALELFNKKNDGFHRSNFKMIDFAGVFYLVLGLFLTFNFLKTIFSKKSVYISLFILFFATSLYYYGIDETGMSHVYSFFLISLFLFLTKLLILDSKNIWIEFIYGFTIGLIFLIRPLNIIVFTFYFVFETNSINDVKIRLNQFLKNHRLQIIIFISSALVIFPQLLYWKYTYGHWIYYSYENEGFKYLFNPQILKVWFSTLNGQFLYVPATSLFLLGSIILYKREKIISIYTVLIFLIISYLFASWWSWNFGCGFGIRPFVDFFPIFAISLTALVEKIVQNRKKLIVFSIFTFLLIFYNLKLIYSFDGCWYGGIWDWSSFFNWIIK